MAYIKVDHDQRLCKRCSREFKPRTSHQDFCSKGCYRIWGKEVKGHSRGNIDNARRRNIQRLRPYRQHVKDKCNFCGFIPVHICQLDVDHVDGNRQNNDPSNLQTLCANCHRLKTHINQDWK